MGEFAIGVKHLKVTTAVNNIFEEEQMPQNTEFIPSTPAVSKTPVDPNQDAHEEITDARSENVIIQLC